MVRTLIRRDMNLLAYHTNLDSAEHGLAAIAAEALGLQDVVPMRRSPAGWYKLVGFVPAEAVDTVAAAVFEAGAGLIGDYSDCAFSTDGTGWFTPGTAAHPAIGHLAVPERTPEVRWETVVPRNRVGVAISAFISAHPYEEPAFDVYPVEDVRTRTGLGRVGTLAAPATVSELARRAATLFELTTCGWSGDGSRIARRVGVLPGSGRSLLQEAAGLDALITGDLTYHDAERAEELGVTLICVPHDELEWWCLRRWAGVLRVELAGSGVEVGLSEAWRSPWSSVSVEAGRANGASVNGVGGGETHAGSGAMADSPGSGRRLRLRVDGGSRGNPGPGAIGVILEDAGGTILQTLGRTIGVCTNNVAEYRALLAGLEMAHGAGAHELEILADSELLVKQLRGEYRVKNEGLKPLHREALEWLQRFSRVSIRHVPRAENAGADRLVNKALDDAASAGL
jgi:ribonuclease HI